MWIGKLGRVVTWLFWRVVLNEEERTWAQLRLEERKDVADLP